MHLFSNELLTWLWLHQSFRTRVGVLLYCTCQMTPCKSRICWTYFKNTHYFVKWKKKYFCICKLYIYKNEVNPIKFFFSRFRPIFRFFFKLSNETNCNLLHLIEQCFRKYFVFFFRGKIKSITRDRRERLRAYTSSTINLQTFPNKWF